MPRKPKTTETEPEAKPAEAAPEAPRGSKTAAIKSSLEGQPKEAAKEIAELMNAEGWDVTAQRISAVKSALKAKKKKAAPAPNSGSRTRSSQGRRVGWFAGQSQEAGEGTGRGEGS